MPNLPPKPTTTPSTTEDITGDLDLDALEEVESAAAARPSERPKPPPRTQRPPAPTTSARASKQPSVPPTGPKSSRPEPRPSGAPSGAVSGQVRTPLPSIPLAPKAPTAIGATPRPSMVNPPRTASNPPGNARALAPRTTPPPLPPPTTPSKPGQPIAAPAKAATKVPPKTPLPIATPLLAQAPPKKAERARTVGFDGSEAPRPPSVEIREEPQVIAPSETMKKTAERPLATQPGVASLQVERAKGIAAEVERHLAGLRAQKKRGDDARIARLLLEDALAWERTGDLARAAELFDEAMGKAADLLPAVQGARRLLWGLREGEGGARPRITMPFVKQDDGGGPTIASVLALLDREARLCSKEGERADLLVERARILEAAKEQPAKVVEALRNALTLRPSHAEALKALEGALLRARAEAEGDDAVAKADAELAAHYGRLAGACGGDPELVASYLAARGLLLERLGDFVGAEEAYAAALVADGRVGPIREAYKRLLAKRAAFGRLRDVVAEEAGREHDLARSVRLLYEAARISNEQLADAAQAVTLLEHAAARAPTDPAVDVRVLDELVRLLETRGDAKSAAQARQARIAHETEPTLRAIEHRRLASDHERASEPLEAIAAYEAARALEPLHVPTQLALDRLYAGAGNHRARVQLWLDEAAKARDAARRAAAYVRAAHVAEDDLEAPDEALDYLRAAWVTDTSNVDAFDELTRLLQPTTEVRNGVGAGEGRSARALIDLFLHAAQTASEPARRIAYLEKVAALWEDALGDPARAAEVYLRVLALEPQRRFALLALQRAYERAGNFRGLAEAVEQEADQATDAPHAAGLRLRAAEIWTSRVGDSERALVLVRRVLETQADHPQALRALLKAHEKAGRHEEVVDTLKKTIALIKPAQAKDAVPLWLEVGDIERLRLGRLDEAIGAWRAALAIDPQHPVATRELAHALRERGSWRAVAELEEQIGTSSTDPATSGAAWVRAAEAWEGRLGEDERAQAAFAKALSLRADDLSAWEGLARIAERRGALKELEAAYRLRIDREDGPVRLGLRLALGELLVRRGDDADAAADVLESVLAEHPSGLHALRLVEGIHRKTKNDSSLARALTMMAQAVRDPLAKRGILWDLVRLQEGHVAGSPPIAAYLLIYELDPHDEAALAGIVRLATMRLRGELLVSRDQPSDGLPNVRGLLAFGLRKQVDLTADAAAKTSIELRLADVLEDSLDRREVGEALSLYRSALARDPESPTACAGVRRVASALGDLAAQLEGEERAADLAAEPANKVVHLLRAADVALRGRVAQGGQAAPIPDGEERAVTLSMRALAADPDSVEAATMTSQLLLARHDARRLVDVLMEAASAAKKPERIVTLAREGARVAHTQLQNTPVAVAMLMQARAAKRWDADVLVELGDLYAEQRAWAEAAKAYEDATDDRSGAATSLLVHAHKKLAELHEGPLDDGGRALEHLAAVARLAPGDTTVQRRRATLLFDQGDWAGAESALEALAASGSLPQNELCDVLLQLCELRLTEGDKPGAESALRQAVRVDPDPTHAPFVRLEAFHTQQGSGDAGLAQALLELAAAPSPDPRWLLRLGQLEVHRLGRPHEGLAHLRTAITALAQDATAQLAYGEALLAVGAHDDAARTLRELIARDPTNAPGLQALHAALTALGRRDEASVVEEVRAYCSYTPDAAKLRARRLPTTPPRPEVLEDVVIYSHVMPGAAKIPALEIVVALADQLAKVFPPDLAALGVGARDRLGPRSGHPFRAHVDRAAQALGIGEVDLYVHSSPDQRLLVENTDTPAIVLPASLGSLPELEVAFAIGRLASKIATRTYVVDKLRPEELEELVYAAVAPFGGPPPRRGHDEVEELSRRLQKAVSRKARRQLEEVAPRLQPLDAARFCRALDQGAIRTGYLLTGDLTSALDHVRRYDDVPPANLGRAETTTGELIRFALGGDASTLRRRLGTTWSAS